MGTFKIIGIVAPLTLAAAIGLNDGPTYLRWREYNKDCVRFTQQLGNYRDARSYFHPDSLPSDPPGMQAKKTELESRLHDLRNELERTILLKYLAHI